MSFSLISEARRGVILSVALLAAACSGGDAADGDNTPADASAASTDVNTADGALGDMVLGADDAPITVFEFASTTCPHCATFHEEVFPAIKKDYVDTGKVRFVFREFPTAPANLAFASSMIARCAADKGGDEAYFAVLGALFKTQRTWITAENPRDELVKISTQVGMTEQDFDACVQRQELLELINENVTSASDKYGIRSTPSFVIDGQLRLVSSVDEFAKALDEALEKKQAE